MFIYPLLSIFARSTGLMKGVPTNQISAGFSGGIYGIYLLLGWMVKQRFFCKIKKRYLICVSFVSILIAVCFQLWVFSRDVDYNIWYSSPFLLVTSVMIFEVISRFKINDSNNVLTWLANYSFGIYLIHYPLKLFLLGTIMGLSVVRKVQVLIMWCVLVIISLMIAIMISLIPKIGNCLIYRR